MRAKLNNLPSVVYFGLFGFLTVSVGAVAGLVYAGRNPAAVVELVLTVLGGSVISNLFVISRYSKTEDIASHNKEQVDKISEQTNGKTMQRFDELQREIHAVLTYQEGIDRRLAHLETAARRRRP